MEVKCEGDGFEGKCWVIFLYASTDDGTRRQWEVLKQKRTWGERWIMGGDFNEIIGPADKNRGNKRTHLILSELS